MKFFRHFIYILIGFIFFSFSCKINSKKSTSKNCNETAKVVNYKSLDGCNLLLQLEDGTFLHPYLDDASPCTFEDLQKSKLISISYSKKEDMATICMKGTIVSITCFSIIEEGKPFQPEDKPSF